jgi:plastocyanin
VVLSASLWLIACSGGTKSAPAPAKPAETSQAPAANTPTKVNTIVISGFKYQPETMTVNAGETVEWKNEDIVPHTATSSDGKTFDSGSIAKGASWRFTPKEKGTFDYICTLHPNMKAKLVVQ